MKKNTGKSRYIIYLIALSFGLAGVLESLFWNPDDQIVIAFLHGFFIGISLFIWCDMHAEENKISVPTYSRVLCFLLAPVGVPYYFLRGFGLKQGGLKTLIAVALSIVMLGFYFLTFSLTIRVTEGYWPPIF